MQTPVILIPARLGSTRLARKPLAHIAGQPMIVQTWRRAQEASVGDVVVATDCDEIVQVIEAQGGKAVMTHGDHASGSDRVFEALQRYDPLGKYTSIINLQGDLPNIEPDIVRACLALLEDKRVDIATAAAPIERQDERENPHIVKVIGSPLSPTRLRALYFTRAQAPWGEGPFYNHIGIYAYQRQALENFVHLPASTLEIRERLEQLRALEAGMRIDVALVPQAPQAVDTHEDLLSIRKIMGEGR